MSSREEQESRQREMELFEEELNAADRLPLEDKIVAAYDERSEVMSPWAIDSLVQEAMAQLPEDLTQEQREDVYDIMYETIATALDNAR